MSFHVSESKWLSLLRCPAVGGARVVLGCLPSLHALWAVGFWALVAGACPASHPFSLQPLPMTNAGFIRAVCTARALVSNYSPAQAWWRTRAKLGSQMLRVTETMAGRLGLAQPGVHGRHCLPAQTHASSWPLMCTVSRVWFACCAESWAWTISCGGNNFFFLTFFFFLYLLNVIE